LFAARGSTHKLLITTRQSNLGDSYGQNAPSEVRQACMLLAYDDYDEEDRSEILRLKSRLLSPWQHDFVTAHERMIVKQLGGPLSIDRFVSAVRFEKSGAGLKLLEMLRKADIEELGATLEAE